MSNITNDGLTRSGIGCFIDVPMATVGRQRVNTASSYMHCVLLPLHACSQHVSTTSMHAWHSRRGGPTPYGDFKNWRGSLELLETCRPCCLQLS